MISHQLWLERPRWLMQRHRMVVTSVIAVVLYAVGLFLAVFGNVSRAYLSSPAFILGAVGVGWVIASLNVRARRVDSLYQEIGPVFTGPPSVYITVVTNYFERICSIRGHAATGGFLFAGVSVAALAAFYAHPVSIGGQTQFSLRPWVFAESWYRGTRLAQFCITLFFGAAISLTLGVSIWVICVELTLLRRLGELPPSLHPEVARVKLRPLADFHARVAADWSVGAFLFFVLFMRSPDAFSIGIVAFCIIVAGVVFSYPHIALSRIVRQCHERKVRVAGRKFSLAVSGHDSGVEPRHDARLLSVLADLTTVTQRPKFWVYSADESLRWALAQAIAFAALGLQVFNYAA